MRAIFQRGNHFRVTQQAFRRENNQRLAPVANRLSSQHMKILRGRGGLDDLNVVLGCERKNLSRRALECSVPCLQIRAATITRVPTVAAIAFRAGDELVNDDLRGIRKITELRFPKRQRFRAIEAVTIFKTEGAGFAKRAVDNFHGRLFGREML